MMNNTDGSSANINQLNFLFLSYWDLANSPTMVNQLNLNTNSNWLILAKDPSICFIIFLLKYFEDFSKFS